MSCVSFIVDWFDSNAATVRRYRLNFYADETLELINTLNKQTFLKRTYCPTIKKHDLFIGASITVFSRQLHLTDYADEGTRLHYESHLTRPFVLVKAAGMVGAVLAKISPGFKISRMRMLELNAEGAERFSAAPGSVVAIESAILSPSGTDIANVWGSLFAEFGEGVYVSTDGDDAEFCFSQASASYAADGSEVTACILKPHVLSNRAEGDVLSAIFEAGFQVTALELMHLDKTMASNFFNVYQGVLAEYAQLVAHMVEGNVIFLQITGPSVVENFREFCGPSDVEIAKVLRPKSLRACFGVDKVMNAVHCTDLPEDGQIECAYFKHLISVYTS